MQLSLIKEKVLSYKSAAQKTRILTEDWVHRWIYCPSCGGALKKCDNNEPVLDFLCQPCREGFELKSKKGRIGSKVIDGAYRTMIERLTSRENPNFFFLNYHPQTLVVQNFLVIPRYFFVPGIIEKRKPLSEMAKRAGWVGCNIILTHIPQAGRIFLVRDGKEESRKKVIANWRNTLFLRDQRIDNLKGWILDVMRCIDALGKSEFSLDEIYSFEEELSLRYPRNKHIKDKIRQQLQFLRDKGYLEFLSRGRYRVSLS